MPIFPALDTKKNAKITLNFFAKEIQMKTLTLCTLVLFGFIVAGCATWGMNADQKWMYERCSAGKGGACNDLAYSATRSINTILKSRAKKFYKKGCELKYGKSCYTLATKYDIKDNEKTKLVQKSCDFGYSEACYELATNNSYKISDAERVNYAKKAYQKIDCYESHIKKTLAQVKVKDKNTYNLAEQFARQNCYFDEYDIKSYIWLGEVYQYGRYGLDKDVKLALHHYRKPCELFFWVTENKGYNYDNSGSVGCKKYIELAPNSAYAQELKQKEKDK